MFPVENGLSKVISTQGFAVGYQQDIDCNHPVLVQY